MNNTTDISADLTSEVHSCIINEQFTKKLSLKNGKIGLLLYHSLHSELYADAEEREYCQDLINEIANLIVKSDKINRDFFEGPLSFPYVVRILSNMSIMDYNQEMKSFFDNNLMSNVTLNTVPSIIIGDRCCIGEAMFLMSLFDDIEDSLRRYSLQESLITLIDHCGRLFYEDVSPLYWRDEMSCQYLHSIYFFLQWAQRHNIYPTKVDKLLKFIDNMSEKSNEENNVIHQQILRKLQGNEVDLLGDVNISVDGRLNIFALLGIYSFLYDINILKDFIHVVYKSSPSDILIDLKRCYNISDQILGIGIGLLYCKFNENKTINHE